MGHCPFHVVRCRSFFISGINTPGFEEDGRKYSFRVRAENNSWVSYTQSFATKKDTWQEVTLNIEDFYPTYRGYNLRDIPKLSESIIREVGLMISDKVEGNFKIDIDWIKVQ